MICVLQVVLNQSVTKMHRFLVLERSIISLKRKSTYKSSQIKLTRENTPNSTQTHPRLTKTIRIYLDICCFIRPTKRTELDVTHDVTSQSLSCSRRSVLNSVLLLSSSGLLSVYHKFVLLLAK